MINRDLNMKVNSLSQVIRHHQVDQLYQKRLGPYDGVFIGRSIRRRVDRDNRVYF